jgi:hypothetical protein
LSDDFCEGRHIRGQPFHQVDGFHPSRGKQIEYQLLTGIELRDGQ